MCKSDTRVRHKSNTALLTTITTDSYWTVQKGLLSNNNYNNITKEMMRV